MVARWHFLLGWLIFWGGGLLYYPWRTKDELPTGHRLVIPDVSTVTEVTPVTGTVPRSKALQWKGLWSHHKRLEQRSWSGKVAPDKNRKIVKWYFGLVIFMTLLRLFAGALSFSFFFRPTRGWKENLFFFSDHFLKLSKVSKDEFRFWTSFLVTIFRILSNGKGCTWWIHGRILCFAILTLVRP